MNYSQFIEELINQGYSFFVSPQGSKIVVELSFRVSYFGDGDEIRPPQELPQLPHKAIARRDQEDYDEPYVVFIWTFELNEWPAEPPRQ